MYRKKITRAAMLLIIALILNLFAAVDMSGDGIMQKSINKVQAQELIGQRDMYTKYYQNEDGTMTAKVGLTPLHYQSENGDYEDIDLKIVKEKKENFEYSAKKNTFKSYFNDADSIENNTMAGFEIINSEGKVRNIKYKLFGANPVSISHKDNEFKYTNVFDGVDLEYILSSERLKENVIVNKPVEEYKFTFTLELDENILLEEKDNGIIEFIDKDTQEVLWKIEKPYAEDSKNLKTQNVKYQLHKENNNYQIDLILEDEEFLKNAVYPVIIDPTMNVNDISSCYTWGTGSYEGSANTLDVGDDERGSDTAGEQHMGIKFDIDLPEDAIIRKANLMLYKKTSTGKGDYEDSDFRIILYNAENDWNNDSGEPLTGERILEQSYNVDDGWMDFDITDVVKHWVNGRLPNYGIIGHNHEVSKDEDVSINFAGSTSSNSPYIIIEYEPKTNASIRIEDIVACKRWGTGDKSTAVGILVVQDDNRGDNTGEYRSGLKFNIDLYKGFKIMNAKLWMYCASERGADVEEDDSVIELYYPKSDWNNDDDYPEVGSEILTKNYASQEKKWMDFDVTDVVKKWLNGTRPNYGILFKNCQVGTNESTWAQFIGSSGSAEFRPYIEITYLNPEVEITLPYENQIFSDEDTSIQPQIEISNPGGNTITCKYYIDSETTPRSTKTTQSTQSTITFDDGFNADLLNSGLHTIKFEVDCGINDHIIKTIDISKIDCEYTSTVSEINISSNMNICDLYTYRYTIDSSSTSWVSQRTYSKIGLTPNTLYSANFEVKDEKGLIKEKSINIYTKSMVPGIRLNNQTATAMDIIVADNNPSTTQYQIMVNNKYVTSTGTLITTPTWITLTNKTKTITGLSSDTVYSVKAKAKNGEGVETVWSSRVSGKTIK